MDQAAAANEMTRRYPGQDKLRAGFVPGPAPPLVLQQRHRGQTPRGDVGVSAADSLSPPPSGHPQGRLDDETERAAASPPPLWGRDRVGGNHEPRRSWFPPPLTPPHKGQGNPCSACRTSFVSASRLVAGGPTPSAGSPRGPALRRLQWLAAVVMLGACAVLCCVDKAAAQSADQVHINIAPRIIAKVASEVALAIEIGPAHIVPPRSFVSLRGLPLQVSLREGHLVAPGLWSVPLSALPSLRVWIPPDISGHAEIGVRLIALDGRLLAQATTALVFEPNPGQPAPAKPAPSAPKVAARQPPPSNVEQERGSGAASGPSQPPPTERARAEHLLARGLDYLAVGNVAAARDFFERAAEIGLAAAALRLAATYDPAELPRLKVHGVVADRALARKWYERAQGLGAPEAASRLARLGGSN